MSTVTVPTGEIQVEVDVRADFNMSGTLSFLRGPEVAALGPNEMIIAINKAKTIGKVFRAEGKVYITLRDIGEPLTPEAIVRILS